MSCTHIHKWLKKLARTRTRTRTRTHAHSLSFPHTPECRKWWRTARRFPCKKLSPSLPPSLPLPPSLSLSLPRSLSAGIQGHTNSLLISYSFSLHLSLLLPSSLGPYLFISHSFSLYLSLHLSFSPATSLFISRFLRPSRASARTHARS